jgi:hypothetical protein
VRWSIFDRDLATKNKFYFIILPNFTFLIKYFYVASEKKKARKVRYKKAALFPQN